MDVLSQLWQREGAWGVWKGTNVTFLYSLLLKTVETWTRSMLAALLNLPDPGLLSEAGGGVGGLDILDSPLPFASLGVVVVAAGVAGLLLAPLDIVRTRYVPHAWPCQSTNPSQHNPHIRSRTTPLHNVLPPLSIPLDLPNLSPLTNGPPQHPSNINIHVDPPLPPLKPPYRPNNNSNLLLNLHVPLLGPRSLHHPPLRNGPSPRPDERRRARWQLRFNTTSPQIQKYLPSSSSNRRPPNSSQHNR